MFQKGDSFLFTYSLYLFKLALDSIFSVLWNNEKSREKCRIVLNAIIDFMRADNKKVKDETIEKR